MKLGGTLKNWARRIARDGVALGFAVKDPRTPWYAKAIGIVVAAYALSPIDLIPDFIPVLGYLDELVLLPGLVWLAVRLLPPDVLAQCRAQADEWLHAQRARPRSRLGAALVVALWLAALALGLWWFMRR